MKTKNQNRSQEASPTKELVGVDVPRLVRAPWSADEDESIKLDYACANGAFNSYRVQAAELNRKFHGGKSVRSAAAVRRRESKLLSGSANDKNDATRSVEHP